MTTQVLDQTYVDALTSSVTEIFESMIIMAPKSIDPTVPPNGVVRQGVIGSLGFTGSKSGLMVLAGSRELVTAMCANMLMMDPSDLTDEAEIADSFGEIVNMVLGNFKNAWVDGGNEMDLSIPSVTFGNEVELGAGKDVSVAFAADVTFESGTMRIELRMHD